MYYEILDEERVKLEAERWATDFDPLYSDALPSWIANSGRLPNGLPDQLASKYGISEGNARLRVRRFKEHLVQLGLIRVRRAA